MSNSDAKCHSKRFPHGSSQRHCATIIFRKRGRCSQGHAYLHACVYVWGVEKLLIPCTIPAFTSCQLFNTQDICVYCFRNFIICIALGKCIYTCVPMATLVSYFFGIDLSGQLQAKFICKALCQIKRNGFWNRL